MDNWGQKMLAKLILLVMVGLSLAEPTWAACIEDSIDTVSEDGDLIILTSGQSYDVMAGDASTAAQWQEGDDVLVCGDTIINKDERGEKIEVTLH
jgi:hypothetical protein